MELLKMTSWECLKGGGYAFGYLLPPCPAICKVDTMARPPAALLNHEVKAMYGERQSQ